MTVADNIKAIRNIFNVTQRELAEVAGVTENAVSKWENGYAEPRMGAVEKIAACYGLSKLNIIEDGGMDNFDPVTRKERPAIPGAVPIAPSPAAYLPVMGNIHAGAAEEPCVYSGEMAQVPAWVEREHPNAFLLKVEGDCMDRVYPEGCMVAIDPDAEAVSGCVAAVQIDDTDFVMRRYIRTADTLVLSPDSFNPAHRDRVFTRDDWDDHFVRVVGRVVWFMGDGELR